MSSLSIAGTVAAREIRERSRSKAYRIASVLTLLIVVGIIVIPTFFEGGTNEYTVGSLGEGNEEIVAAAELIGNASVEDGDPPAVEMTLVTFEDEVEGEAAVQSGDVDALLVDGSTIVTESAGGFGGSSVVGLLQRGASTVELEQLAAENPDAAAEIIEVMTTDSLESVALSGDDTDREAEGVLAYAGIFMLYIAILLYGTWILSGVTEEKTNRVVEVLLASVKPWQLLAGKIIGIGTLGLAQFGLTIIFAAIAVQITGVLDLPELPIASVSNLILWFIIGFLVYAVLFATAGSLASRMEDAQTTSMPITMIAVGAFFMSILTLDDPDGTVALIGTLIPLTAPFVVPVRVALDAIPWWQYGLSIIITVGSIVGLLVIAGRVYAGGLLQYGGRIKIRQAWRSASN
jgi:ABC-2 type transport system permease protein